MEKALSDIKAALRFLVGLVLTLIIFALLIGVLFGDVFGVFDNVASVIGGLNKDGFVGFLTLLVVSVLAFIALKKE